MAKMDDMQSEATINSILIQKYAEVVDLESLRALAEKSPHLAGLFVPCVTESYLTSRRKIMIVGKETRGWGDGAGGKKGLLEANQYSSASAYVHHLTQRHADVLRKPPTRSKFFQFYRDASRVVDKNHAATDAIVWANLFCLSHRSGSPAGCPESFDAIKALSKTLLHTQIEVCQPDVILFVTGTGYDKYIKEFFKITNSERLVPRSLWSFKVNQIQAYRTSHPQWERGREFRKRALALAMEGGGRESTRGIIDAAFEPHSKGRSQGHVSRLG